MTISEEPISRKLESNKKLTEKVKSFIYLRVGIASHCVFGNEAITHEALRESHVCQAA